MLTVACEALSREPFGGAKSKSNHHLKHEQKWMLAGWQVHRIGG
jgi:hypothetical protein